MKLNLTKALWAVLACATLTFNAAPVLAKPESSAVTLQPAWTLEGIDTPESVIEVANKRQTFYLVSAIEGDFMTKDGKGGLVKINSRGEMLDKNWVTGLNAPKGMAQFKDKVYVADIDEVVVVDINTAKIIEKIPMPDAILLNDVAADARGTIYISDTFSGRVYRIKNQQVDIYIEGLWGPNGLWAEPDRLIVSAANQIFAYNSAKEAVQLGSNFALDIDGITPFKCNGYLVSSWDGMIWFFSKTGEQTVLLDSVAQGINTADIMYSEKAKLLFVPNFLNNSVTAYRVKNK